ncbi:MAG: hypothetical protein RSG51_02315, partial [Bacilli bacterium]
MKKKNLYKTLTFILTFMTCFLLCNNIYAKKLGDNGKQKFEESANRDFLMCEYGAGMKGSLSNAIISIYYNRTTKKIYVNYNLSRFEVFGDNAVYYQSNIDNNTHIVTTKDDDSLDKLKYQGICPAEVSYRGDITCPIFTDCRDFLCFSSEVGKCNKEYGGIFVNGVINGPLMSDYSKVIGESWPKIFSVIRDHTPSIETCEDVLANVDYSTKEYDDIVKEAFFKGYPLPS